MKSNFNAVDGMEKREKVLGNRRVHWASVHDVDWLSAENTGTKSPWHYSKHKSYLSGCAVAEVNGWRAYWDVRKHYIPFATFVRYYNQMKFADFLLSDSHDDKEGY